MSEAVLHYEPEDVGPLTGGPTWEALARGFAGQAGGDALRLWRPSGRGEGALRPPPSAARPIEWILGRGLRHLREAGVAHLPGAALAQEAWLRRPVGPAVYALSGLVSDLSTSSALERLAGLAAAPLEPWDAVVFTSDALRRSYEHQAQALREDLAARLGATRFPAPQLAVIPMGVDTAAVSLSADLRGAQRRRLGIADDAVAVLQVAAPAGAGDADLALMGAALQLAAERSDQDLVWLVGHEGKPPSIAGALRTAWPRVAVKPVALKGEDARRSLFAAADLYLDLATGPATAPERGPLEALAAGLPLVVCDWGGARELVRHGLDGFRVRTLAPRAGLGRDLAFQHAAGMLGDAALHAAAGRMTAVDLNDAAGALARLVLDSDLRRRMAQAARAHAVAAFDWPVVLSRYRDLWAEQTARRQAALRDGAPPAAADPRHPDPFALFSAFATAALSPASQIALTPGMSWPEAHNRLAADAPGGALPTLEEAERVFQSLAAAGVLSVRDITAPFGPRAGVVERGLSWMARLEIVAQLGRPTLAVAPGG